MMYELSANTKAILLLTASLKIDQKESPLKALTLGQYKSLAKCLREHNAEPADLLSGVNPYLLDSCERVLIEAKRYKREKGDLERLLGRGFQLSMAIEAWHKRAIWVVSRADTEYPRRLKSLLREDAPPVLYGCGDMALLETGGLAVVGSRQVDDALIDYTIAVGRLAARAGRTLVSGGAKGIDQAAMRGAIEKGGKVCGVLADSLEKTTMNREHRNLLLDGQLVLISPYDPSAGFDVGNAMQRNKLIYALADASLVVSSDLNKGGTWAGAVEQLDKLKFGTIYVRSTGEFSVGLDALREKGARYWPNPQDVDSFEALFNVGTSTPEPAADERVNVGSVQSMVMDVPPYLGDKKELTLLMVDDKQPDVKAPEAQSLMSSEPVAKHGLPDESAQIDLAPSDELLAAVRVLLLRMLKTPMEMNEIAEALGVPKTLAKQWLQRLVDGNVLEKMTKPVRYKVFSVSEHRDFMLKLDSRPNNKKSGDPGGCDERQGELCFEQKRCI